MVELKNATLGQLDRAAKQDDDIGKKFGQVVDEVCAGRHPWPADWEALRALMVQADEDSAVARWAVKIVDTVEKRVKAGRAVEIGPILLRCLSVGYNLAK